MAQPQSDLQLKGGVVKANIAFKGAFNLLVPGQDRSFQPASVIAQHGERRSILSQYRQAIVQAKGQLWNDFDLGSGSGKTVWETGKDRGKAVLSIVKRLEPSSDAKQEFLLLWISEKLAIRQSGAHIENPKAFAADESGGVVVSQEQGNGFLVPQQSADLHCPELLVGLYFSVGNAERHEMILFEKQLSFVGTAIVYDLPLNARLPDGQVNMNPCCQQLDGLGFLLFAAALFPGLGMEWQDQTNQSKHTECKCEMLHSCMCLKLVTRRESYIKQAEPCGSRVEIINGELGFPKMPKGVLLRIARVGGTVLTLHSYFQLQRKSRDTLANEQISSTEICIWRLGNGLLVRRSLPIRRCIDSWRFGYC